ncbi:MAG: hypothetical protein FJW69_03400 [Actinobacteria bacterium]|nr:hypothetical protein [Actinomycetota bacterium]MBM3713340.1 hypothetical protein [Actinomycetota bacterium]
MEIIAEKIPISRLQDMAANMFGNLVKAVIDIKKEIIAIDGELHSDEEALLLEAGSNQRDLWGINIYPELPAEDRIEFDSMINLRPSQNNRTRGIDDPKIKSKVIEIVNKLIEEK